LEGVFLLSCGDFTGTQGVRIGTAKFKGTFRSIGLEIGGTLHITVDEDLSPQERDAIVAAIMAAAMAEVPRPPDEVSVDTLEADSALGARRCNNEDGSRLRKEEVI
jgi:hypothetical protein